MSESHDATRLVADAMLGSLARKLRAFGFDTIYFNKGGDLDLIALAVSESRVILTSDGTLHSRAVRRGIPSFFVEGRSDGRRIRSLIDSSKESGRRLLRGGPRCSLCNGTLQLTKRGQVSSSVPPPVLTRHRLFLRCLSCGKVYWRGGHWKKLSALERAFGKRSDARR